jgi:hypothetical protein
MRYYDLYESPHGQMLLVAGGEGLPASTSLDRNIMRRSNPTGAAMRTTRRCAR